MRIAVFGHDAGHAMLARRIAGLQSLGHDVVGLTMRREADRPRNWPNTDLGLTHDGRFFQRALMVRQAARRVVADQLTEDADLLWARNLDMLAVAVAAQAAMPHPPPIVYETLDIHDLLAGDGAINALLRAAERRWLTRVSAIVISSPGFEREYYARRHPGHPPTVLIENTLLDEGLPARPSGTTDGTLTGRPFKLGWVGHLRCRETLALLEEVSGRMAGSVQVIARGQPALSEIPDFVERVGRAPHMTWEGPYDAATDLPAVYGDLDAVWAGVTHQQTRNARWLLPNRVYEAGYFGVPAIAIAGTETDRFLKTYGIGASVTPPLAESLMDLLASWQDTAILMDLRARVLRAPRTLFARTPNELSRVLDIALGTPDPSA